MNENLKAFLDKVAEDKDWIERHKGIADKDGAVAAALKKAEELGVPLTVADFEAPEGELSEEELAAVSGGGVCFCEIGGGGTADDSAGPHGTIDEVCACVFGGWGSYTSENGETDTRCVCVQLGSGASYY